MAHDISQASLDRQAQVIADLLDELPWCECTGFLVVEEENGEEPDAELNQYLQAFDVLVFDGYVTDFVRLVRGLCDSDSLTPRFHSHELVPQVTVDCQSAEDPNQVPLSLMIHYHGPDDAYLSTRGAVLSAMEEVARRAVEEWTQEEEEDEEPVETLV